MDRINLNEYDLLPFDLEKCKAGHLMATLDGVAFEYAGLASSSNLELIKIRGAHGVIMNWSRRPREWVGPFPYFDLFLAVKKTVEKPKRTKGVNTYQINVRRGLEIIVNVEVDE
jgi:hypothetical protein